MNDCVTSALWTLVYVCKCNGKVWYLL